LLNPDSFQTLFSLLFWYFRVEQKTYRFSSKKYTPIFGASGDENVTYNHILKAKPRRATDVKSSI
jgi:hypothetical protein